MYEDSTTADVADALTPTEQSIAAVWCEELAATSPLRPDDNFFSLGGDSVSMMIVLFRIEETFSVEMPVATLLEAPELRSFCARVDMARSRETQTIAPNVL